LVVHGEVQGGADTSFMTGALITMGGAQRKAIADV
jgi:hypothetical protein